MRLTPGGVRVTRQEALCDDPAAVLNPLLEARATET
jgi:hypothetical protein